jgi:hypothetical protein
MYRAGRRGAPLIFEDHSGGEKLGRAGRGCRNGSEVVAACVTEAHRHASALAKLDEAVGQSLSQGSGTFEPMLLQELDLLRQEAEGLARLLSLATSLPSAKTLIEYDAIEKCVPLAAQRVRLMS